MFQLISVGNEGMHAAFPYKKLAEIKAAYDANAELLQKLEDRTSNYPWGEDHVSESYEQGYNNALEFVFRTLGISDPNAIGDNSVQTEAKKENEVRVATPDGDLYAYVCDDDEIPGIQVMLEAKDGTKRVLALVEYTKGETSNGFDPEHPEHMAKEQAEVPASRRGKDINAHCFEVTPGLICRSCPLLYDEDADHLRTIYDYSDPDAGKQQAEPVSIHTAAKKHQPCGYCMNAKVVPDLCDDNDLHYHSIGEMEKGYRLMLTAGAGKPCHVIVEQWREPYGWSLIGYYYPDHCPKCGRPITEYGGKKPHGR